MTTHPRLGSFIVLALLAVAGLAGTTPVHAQTSQSSRLEVFVARFEPVGETRGNFGRDIMRELNELIADLQSHVPADEDVVKNMLKQLNTKEEEVNTCISARQFANRISSNLAMCGKFEDIGDDQYRVTPTTLVLDVNEEFHGEPFVAKEPEEAAQRILSEFIAYAELLKSLNICYDYFQSQQFENAIENCDKVIAGDPENRTALMLKGDALLKLERREEALAVFERVNELDQGTNIDALYRVGYVSTQLGQVDKGREFFRRYLALNPGDASVRQTLAMAQDSAGDPEGALAMLEEGMQGGGETPANLVAYAGGLAIKAAENRKAAGDTAGAMPFYEKAIEYMMPTYEAEGAETSAAIVRNILAAYSQLGDLQRMADFAERAIQTHPNEPGILIPYAQMLQRLDQPERALEILAQAEAADPDARIYRMKAIWLLEDGKLDEAVAAGRRGVENGEWQDPNELARNIAARGHNDFAQQGEFQQAIRYYEAAAELAVSDEAKAFVNFFHGYALLKLYGQPFDDVEKLPNVAQSKAALPHFTRAKTLLDNAVPYTTANPRYEQNRQDWLKAIDQYVAMAEAIIKRGGSG